MSDHDQPHVATLVHFGAGLCRELDSHRVRADRVVLVEARRAAVEALGARAAGMADVRVVHAAVDGRGDGPRTFRVFNLPDASGLREPTGYLRIAPGLKIEKQFELTPVKASSLLDEHAGQEGGIALVIDLAGEEAEVLDELRRAGLLSYVSDLRVHCGVAPLYGKAKGADAIAARLDAAGFQDVQTEGAGPMKVVTGRRTVLASDHLEQLAALEEALAAASEDHVKALARRDEEISQSREALTESDVRIEQMAARLETLETAAAEAESARDDALVRLEEREHALAERDAQIRTLRDEHEAETASLAKTLKEVESARDEAQSALKDQEGILAERDVQIRTLRDEHGQAAERAEKAQADTAVALRMQAMARADLQDLQERYRAIMEIKREQDGLLSKLTERLGDASRYLSDLPEAEKVRKIAPGKAGKSGKAAGKKKKKSS
jgi:hypothetical protein